MKKGLAVVLATVMLLSLVGCESLENTLFGTWKVNSVAMGDSTFTIAELEAMGDDSLSGMQIILKEGGKAYVGDDGSGELVDWSETEGGVQIGEQTCIIEGDMLCLDMGEGKMYFEKVSDSQIIGGTSEKEEPAKQEKEEPAKQEKPDKSTSSETGSSAAQIDSPADSAVVIKQSPDKYTWYIKNYVGKNCAALGYTSLSEQRMDKYGAGHLELVFIAPDGSYIDIASDENLKQYVVTGQNIAPNTEMKYTFEKDGNGEEYSSLLASQSFEEIVLSVCRIGDSENTAVPLTQMKPSPDKYTHYIADYTGRNLANCGYTSHSGNLMHAYGAAYIKLIIVSEDGSFIDPEDTEQLKNYVVASQNIAPNTEFNLVFMKDSEGVEYDHLVDSQGIEEVEITVRPIG